MRRLFLSVAAAALLAGCAPAGLQFRQNEVGSVIEAGETHVSVLSVTPWEEIRASLSPNFDLTADEAVLAAIPRISAFEEKALDLFAAKLGFGLPQTSVSATRATDLATGGVTGNLTETAAPGELPGADVLPELRGKDRKVSDLPGFSPAFREGAVGGSDPFLRYQAANAVFQYVKVLERLVRDTPQYEGYTPFLVTMQITSFPFARHQPYDLYLDMSFFPRTRGETDVKLDTPIVVPVMITDNLQGEAVSRAAETIRQFSLAAEALTGGIAGALGLTSVSERAASVAGTDLTSTFTVGRTTENALVAVLGAARNPVSDYAMVRRTHNVSVLLFVPKATAEAPTQFDGSGLLRRVDVLTTMALRRPDETGAPLPLALKSFPKSGKRVADRIAELGAQSVPEACVQDLFAYLTNSDYQGFVDKVASCDGDRASAPILYHVMADVYGQSPGFRTTTIPLPPAKAAPTVTFEIPTGVRLVAAFDSEKDGAMSIEIPGTSGRTPKGAEAVLTLKSKSGVATPFVAGAIAAAKGKLVLAFPSPLALGMAGVKETGGSLTLNWVEGVTPLSRTFAVVYQPRPFKAKPAKPAAAATPKGATTETVKVETTRTETVKTTPPPAAAPAPAPGSTAAKS